MPLINRTPAEDAALRAVRVVDTAFDACKQASAMLDQCIWNNPNASAGEVLSALGKNAASVSAFQDLIVAAVNSTKPGEISSPKPVDSPVVITKG